MNDHDEAMIEAFDLYGYPDQDADERAGVAFDPLDLDDVVSDLTNREVQVQRVQAAGRVIRSVQVDRFKSTGYLESDTSPEARLADAIEPLGEILGALSCPYYAGTGDRKCATGCYQEPRCHDAGSSAMLPEIITGFLEALEAIHPGTLDRTFEALADWRSSRDDGIAEQASNIDPEEIF